jgi:intracellular sulfur oxidation DsrE/DsrF family protein
MDRYRVVFHIDEGDIARANMVFHNIQNLIDDMGADSVEVALVANGEGVKALLKSPNGHKRQVKKLADQGVQLLACSNSIRFLGLDKHDILEVVDVVPAGVSELTKRQAGGWAYIRP